MIGAVEEVDEPLQDGQKKQWQLTIGAKESGDEARGSL